MLCAHSIYIFVKKLKMKNIFTLLSLFCITSLNAQISLPIDFENDQVLNEDIVNFNGGSGSVVNNPQIDDNNPRENVGVIIRDGGDIWAWWIYRSRCFFCYKWIFNYFYSFPKCS